MRCQSVAASCQSHISQVIAYCLLLSAKVKGHRDHIYFPSPTHPGSGHSSPSTRRNKERRRGGGVQSEGELVAVDVEVEVAAAVGEEGGGGVELEKKYRKGEQRSDSADKERRQGRGCCCELSRGRGWEDGGVMCVFNSGLTPLMLIQPISSFISFLEPKSAICDKVAVATACSPGGCGQPCDGDV